MTGRFGVTRHDEGAGVLRLAVTGEIDGDVSDALSGILIGAVAENGVTTVVVDLREVTFLAAAGVRALLAGCSAAVLRGCGYRVSGAHGIVRQVLEVTGVPGLVEAVVAGRRES